MFYKLYASFRNMASSLVSVELKQQLQYLPHAFIQNSSVFLTQKNKRSAINTIPRIPPITRGISQISSFVSVPELGATVVAGSIEAPSVNTCISVNGVVVTRSIPSIIRALFLKKKSLLVNKCFLLFSKLKYNSNFQHVRNGRRSIERTFFFSRCTASINPFPHNGTF